MIHIINHISFILHVRSFCWYITATNKTGFFSLLSLRFDSFICVILRTQCIHIHRRLTPGLALYFPINQICKMLPSNFNLFLKSDKPEIHTLS